MFVPILYGNFILYLPALMLHNDFYRFNYSPDFGESVLEMFNILNLNEF